MLPFTVVTLPLILTLLIVQAGGVAPAVAQGPLPVEDSGASAQRALALSTVAPRWGCKIRPETLTWSATFHATLSLGVSAFEPLTLALQRCQISLDTG